MRLLAFALLAGCATAPVSRDLDEVPGAAPEVALLVPYGAEETTLPLVVVDARSECAADDQRHVELVYLPTGQTRWSAPGWQAVVGRTADGLLLVSNEDAARASALELGVVEPLDGRERGRCAVSLPFKAGPVEWRQPRPGVLQGLAAPKHYPSGTPTPPDLRRAAVEVRFGRWGCEVLRVPEAKGPPVPDLSPWALKVPGLTLTYTVPGAGETGQRLEARRGGAVAWSKQVGPWPVQPCLLP